MNLNHRQVVMNSDSEGYYEKGASAAKPGSYSAVTADGIAPVYALESERVEQKLLEAGVDALILKAQWNVVLWSIKVKGRELKLKMEALGPVDESALHAWFQHLLGHEWHVHIKLKPVSKCCQSACSGCLAGNPEKRLAWLDIPRIG